MKILSCFDCSKKQKAFCRKHSVSKNSSVCNSVIVNDYEGAKKKVEKR